MHNYYNYEFISPSRLYARIKEEMRSYFSTGIVDDLMFPIWTEDCIKKFRKTFLPIKQDVVFIKEGQGQLPDDFDSIREIWTTSSHTTNPFVVDGSYYYPKDYNVISISDIPLDEHSLNIQVETFEVIRKITGARTYTYQRTHRLVEGIVESCNNRYDIYEICGCTLKTSANTECVHIIYKANATDEDGWQLIPDDYWMQDYIMKYIIYKLHQQIYNQESGETFNQAERRKEEAKAEMYSALANVEIESRKKTTQQKMNDIKKSYNKHNKFRIR